MLRNQNAKMLLTLGFGLIGLLMLVGLTLGVRTLHECNPAQASVRTTTYLYRIIPVRRRVRPLWINTTLPSQPAGVESDHWQRMHEIIHSASGSKIEHDRWGSITDTIDSLDSLALPTETKARLAQRLRDLLIDDWPERELRIFVLRVDTYLRYLIGTEETQPTPEDIDALVERAITTPIED